MKKFFIITNSIKDEDCKVALFVKEFLENKGCDCVVFDNIDSDTKVFATLDPSVVPEDVECVITVGGDGTLLYAARNLKNLDCMFVGINKGNLGFLADILMDNLEESLDRLVSDDFNVESRMMLKAKLVRNDEEILKSNVLNDVVIHRGAEISISNYIVHVNGTLLGNYDADGMIVATPTGSTAYNLSVGGPLARPDSHVMILTPICSHSLGGRSIIFSKNDKVEIEIGEDRKNNVEPRCLSFDGAKKVDVYAGDKVCIEVADDSTKFVKLNDSSFLQTIREKIK